MESNHYNKKGILSEMLETYAEESNRNFEATVIVMYDYIRVLQFQIRGTVIQYPFLNHSAKVTG